MRASRVASVDLRRWAFRPNRPLGRLALFLQNGFQGRASLSGLVLLAPLAPFVLFPIFFSLPALLATFPPSAPCQNSCTKQSRIAARKRQTLPLFSSAPSAPQRIAHYSRAQPDSSIQLHRAPTRCEALQKKRQIISELLTKHKIYIDEKVLDVWA